MKYYITKKGLLEFRQGTLASNNLEDRVLTSFLADNRGLNEDDIIDQVADSPKSLGFRQMLMSEVKETLKHLQNHGAVTTNRKEASKLSFEAEPVRNVEYHNVYPDERGSEYSIGPEYTYNERGRWEIDQ